MYWLRLVPDETHIPFMNARHISLVITAVLCLGSLALFATKGFTYGIDFQGGIVMEVRTAQAVDFHGLRGMVEGLNLGSVSLQEFGSPQDVLIRLERQSGPEGAQQAAIDKVRQAIDTAYPGSHIRRTESVGPAVSQELARDGMISVGLALLAMMVYMWFRFEWQFGVGALATLVVDVILTIGFFSATGLQFNLNAIAAVLTIIGYSINDKVVVYDRMRENLRIYKKMPLRELIDVSINSMLGRTIGTSLTTVLAAVPLALFGGSSLESFSWPIVYGVFAGTLTSIFIAAPILLFLGEKQLRQGHRAEEEAAATPAA